MAGVQSSDINTDNTVKNGVERAVLQFVKIYLVRSSGSGHTRLNAGVFPLPIPDTYTHYNSGFDKSKTRSVPSDCHAADLENNL